MGILHIFDMDGTLLAGSTASLEIARHTGTTPRLLEMEARFAAGELDTRGFSAALPGLWADLTPQVVAAAYAAAPWLGGIAEVCADIRARGEHSLVITMARTSSPATCWSWASTRSPPPVSRPCPSPRPWTPAAS
ncbi:hypothetical protein [Nonomuraea sp. NPDC049625]|uniref:haloacid dehalogenase-like hydrolase n=1 Tax=Nonomuraea sp. NPDC049625 TaxID=3155775 RepID=UPI00341EFAF8